MWRFLALMIPLFLCAEPLKMEVSGQVAVLINAETGAILYEKSAFTPVYPASITKIATALYVLEKKEGHLEEMVTVTSDSLVAVANSQMRASNPYLLQTDGTNMGLRVGEVLPLRALLYGLMLNSANDAANVIAKHVSGNIEKFTADMNHFLHGKGFKNTYFRNPHGLHHQDHRTTAYEMALITKEALKSPTFREIVKTVKYTRPGSNKRKPVEIFQANRLMKRGKLFYPKAIGVKTGYTDSAGFTLSAAAEHEGRCLIAVIMGSSSAEQRYRDAIRLFEAAFAQKIVSRTLFSRDHDHFWLELRKGKESLEAALDEDLCLSYYPAEEPIFKPVLKWEAIRLPVEAGQCVGRLELVTPKGQVVKTAPLYAVRGMDKTAWEGFKDLCARNRMVLVSFSLCLFVAALLFYLLKKPKKVV